MARPGKKIPHQSHDHLVRLFFGQEKIFSDFLINYLDPAVVELIDLERLVYEASADIDGSLNEQISDIRYSSVSCPWWLRSATENMSVRCCKP